MSDKLALLALLVEELQKRGQRKLEAGVAPEYLDLALATVLINVNKHRSKEAFMSIMGDVWDSIVVKEILQ